MSNPTKLAAEELFMRFLGGIGSGFKSHVRELSHPTPINGISRLLYKQAAQPIYDLSRVSVGKVYLPDRLAGWADAIGALGSGGSTISAAAEFRRRHRHGMAEIVGDVVLVPKGHTFNQSGDDEVRFVVTLDAQPRPKARVITMNTFRRIIPVDRLLGEPALPWMLGEWHGSTFL